MTNNKSRKVPPPEESNYFANLFLEGGPDDGRTLRIQVTVPGKFPRAHAYAAPSIYPNEHPYHLYLSTGHVNSENQMTYKYKGLFK